MLNNDCFIRVGFFTEFISKHYLCIMVGSYRPIAIYAGNEPDIIFINEAIPKAQSLPIGRACQELLNFTFFTNFDP